jgi:hypothetical protein
MNTRSPSDIKRDPLASLDVRRRSMEAMAVAVMESVKARGGSVERVSLTEMKVVLPGNAKSIRVVLVRMPRMREKEMILAEQFVDNYKRTRRVV